MGEFDGVSGVAAQAGTWGQSDGVGAERYDVVGADDALITKTEAAGEIEAARQSAEVTGRIGCGTGEAPIVVGTKTGEDGVGLL